MKGKDVTSISVVWGEKGVADMGLFLILIHTWCFLSYLLLLLVLPNFNYPEEN